MKYVKILLLVGLLSITGILVVTCSCDKSTGPTNHPPRIDALKMAIGGVELPQSDTNNVAGTEIIILTAYASDLDGDLLEYSWQCSAGSFESEETNKTAWTAPQTSSIATVTIEVSDGMATVSKSVNFSVTNVGRLSSGSITPKTGTKYDVFSYAVTFTDPDNQEPRTAEVVINGVPYAMFKDSGTIATGALYRFEKSLVEGQHQYFYRFGDYRDSIIAFPTASYAVGPVVSRPDISLSGALVIMDDLDNVVFDRISGSSYQFDYSGLPPEIKPDMIIAGSDSTGYLRRVKSVSSAAGRLVIETDSACLTQAVEQATFDTTITLTLGPDHLQRKDNLNSVSLGENFLVFEEVVDLLDLVLYEGEVNGVYVKAEITEGTIAFNPTLNVGADIDLLSGLKEFHAIACGDIYFSYTFKITANGDFSVTNNITLPPFTWDLWVWLGPPVMIRNTLSFEVGFEAEASLHGEFMTGLDYSNSLCIGARYESEKWGEVWNPTEQLTPYDPNWNAEGTTRARVYVKPQISMEIFAAAGPYMEAEPYLGFDGHAWAPPPCWEWELYAGIDAYLGFQVHLLDFELARWEKTLISDRHVLDRDTGCEEEPICELTPANLSFPETKVGNTSTRTFTIANIGTGTLIGCFSELCDDFSVSPACYRLDSGESEVITVAFSPQSCGVKSCDISTDPPCLDLNCFGTSPCVADCIVDPTRLEFPDTDLLETSIRTFTITNAGDGTLSGSVSESCFYFSVDAPGGLDYNLGAGELKTYTVTFRPQTSGECFDCTINTGCLESVSCRGCCTEPDCKLSPSLLEFPDTEVGQSSTKMFNITNVGSGTMTGTVGQSCRPEFSVTPNTGNYAFSLGPNQSKTYTVTFTPQAQGYVNCDLDITDTWCNDLPLSGTGTSHIGDPECLVSPVMLEFPETDLLETSTETFTIKNVGDGTLSGSVSETCFYFSVNAPDGLEYNLGAGQSKTYTVTFRPQTSGECFDCTINTGCLENVNCRGCCPEPTCELSPSPLEFLDTDVGQSSSKTFTITNVGSGTMTGTVGQSCKPEFTVTPNTGNYAFSLGPNQSKTYTVTFSPQIQGYVSCHLDITGAWCDDLPLSGTGTQ